MSISSRIHDTLEDWQAEWKERLAGWLSNVLGFGIEIFFNILGKAAAPKLTPFVETLNRTGKVPPELQPLLDEIAKPTGQIGALFASSAGGALFGGALSKIADAIFLPLAYEINRLTQNAALTLDQYIVGWLRGVVSDAELEKTMLAFGLPPVDHTVLKKLAEARLNPETVARVWLRDKTKYEELWNDLRDTGISEERIEVFKELAHVMPTPQELTLWAAREAFEPDMIDKYGLEDEYDKLDLSMFEKSGVREDIARLNWIAHWQHPALNTIFDMLHRGLIKDSDVYEYYRLVEIPPHWRDKLTELSWDLPNRIELRMMARYGLVDKAFLVEMLGKVGLKEEYRSVAADMMLAMGIRTDIASRYSKGWLDSEGVKSALAESGLSPEIQERMFQWIVKNTSTDRVAKERDLTVTDIIKGVKKGTISRAEGQTLIEQMGYDSWEAKFKLDINIPIEEQVSEVKDRELTKTDILNALKAGTIEESEALQRLVEIRYSSDNAQFLIDLAKATMTTITTTKERDLTKADIIKGVKNGVITHEEGYLMLTTIGYSSSEANFILSVNVEAEAGSPDTYNEFLAMTQSYRASQKLPHKEVKPELIQAERDLKAAEAALKYAETIKSKPSRITELKQAVERAKILYHQLATQSKVES